MKTLTRTFFCMFVVVFFYSCEPEEIIDDSNKESVLEDRNDEIGDTGDEKTPVDDTKD